MSGLAIGEHELRELVVDRLEALSAMDFSRAVALAHHRRVPLERAVAEQAKLPFGVLLQEVARSWSVPFVDLDVADVREDALTLIPEDLARARLCVAYAATAAEVEVAMVNPRDGGAIEEIARVTGRRVQPRLASVGVIRRAQLLYRTRLFRLLARAGETDTGAAGLSGPQDARVADVLTRILEYAVVAGASDVHIEPFEFDAVVRCRIDGVLHEVLTPVPAVAQALVGRIKSLGAMRVEERRVPQDGRFETDLSGVAVDLRVSTLPTAWGEKVLLRVRPRDSAPLDPESLGLAPVDRALLTSCLSRPSGLILATGPSGAGKTNTLYALLMRVAAERGTAVNLATIEDPIECTLPRVNQVAVNVPAGLDFHHGLRALLRQDPDVILVGEIRDRETADTAVRAALVGRQLFSSLHTSDAPSAVVRLLDLGVEPYLLASTLTLVVAQRLVRRLCVECRQDYRPDARVIDVLRGRADGGELVRGLVEHGVAALEDWPGRVRLFRAAGCTHCRFTGYRGRIGLFELFPMSEAVRPLVLQRRESAVIRAAAVAAGMRTLALDGLAKAIAGETSLDEVFRAAV